MQKLYIGQLVKTVFKIIGSRKTWFEGVSSLCTVLSRLSFKGI